MVSVRKSHHLSEESFEQWLSNLDITDSKESALEQLWHSISNIFNQPSVDENIETKSLEMVEILASLNMDKDSLCAAMLIPLFTEGLIDIAFKEKQCKFLEQNNLYTYHKSFLYLLFFPFDRTYYQNLL